ncbi:ketopantoate reductase [Pseudoxanthobacter soli DSM 19599]|uniref:2-dehydropantoate 2-reductase n=2 Tax=Pseudoxanthobacter TaxID=433838 RepID=A0A1M7ZR86_9HYPH|nr:ketopantoate reductase [Pseudoxanthobacter soli DSM 19599]
MKMAAMKIAVMGAGAVGCYFGALLARAGHDVTLIGRLGHVEAIGHRGLLLDMGGRRHTVPVAATEAPAGVAGADLVLVCVKSNDTEEAGRQMAPHLAPECAVWSLQNGVDNAERLQAVLGREVVPVVVYVAAEMAGPGHVRHHGRGDLVVGPSGASEGLAARLTEAGIPARVSADALTALWTKLIVNCAYNAVSAITGQAYGELLPVPGLQEVMQDAVQECTAVALRLGVPLPADIWTTVLDVGVAMPGQRSSTAQDLARGRRTEIDHLNGYIVRKGLEFGVPTPVNRAMHSLVRALETRSAASAGG